LIDGSDESNLSVAIWNAILAIFFRDSVLGKCYTALIRRVGETIYRE